MEIKPRRHHHQAIFHSQADLLSWMNCCTDANLSKVTTLTIRLRDIDLSSLFDTPPGKYDTVPSTWLMYQRELEALDQALQRLPNLMYLTVTPPDQSHSQLLKGMYLAFLALLRKRLPRLQRLTLHDGGEVVEKVAGLDQISEVHYCLPKVVVADCGTSATSGCLGMPRRNAKGFRGVTRTDDWVGKIEMMEVDGI